MRAASTGRRAKAKGDVAELADAHGSGPCGTKSRGSSSLPIPTMTAKNTKISTSSRRSEVVRFIPLGGLEEIGRNMLFLEYRDEIVIFDAGIQFPEEETPGVDYIIPNTEYLEKHKDKIRGIIITHGHYDHIGAIPYILDKLGNPPIYATEFSKEVIRKRQEDFPNAPKPVFQVVKSGDVREISPHFKAHFFGVTHNIPDGFATLLETPVGNILHAGEFKFDYDKEGNPRGLEMWDNLRKMGVHTMLMENTNVGTPGWSVSERVVEAEIEKLLKGARGRIIISTFSSLMDRIVEIVKIAERLGKVVALTGYSLKTNFEIAKRLGYIKTDTKAIISDGDIKNYPDGKVVILTTGAQGEKNAGLMKMANGEHRRIRLKASDTIIFSSSIIPGNEMSIQNLKDKIARQGPTIYDSKMLDIHSSGHAPYEELKLVLKKVNPKFFIPIHGYFFMRRQGAQMAYDLGMKPENVILTDNGAVTEIRKTVVKMTKEEVPSSYVFVDGLGVGDVGEVVLRDRRALAADGMLVVIAVLGKRSGKILKNPDIISRGFVYLRENQELLNDIRRRIRGIVGRIPQRQSLDADYVKTLIRDQIGEFLFKKTHRRPMVLPVIIEV